MAGNRVAAGLHDRPAVNVGRVILGGLVAGVVANIGDATTNMTILKADMTALAQRFGTDPASLNSLSAGLPWIVVDFVFGLVAVFTYAAMRPRFGPGPKTAILVSVLLNVVVGAVLYGFTSMGMMSTGSFLRGFLSALIVTTIATCAGAAIYKEA